MKKFIALVVFLIVAGMAILFGMRLWSGEDSWVCQSGEWVKHGNPSKAKPAGVCGEIREFNGTISKVDIDGGVIFIELSDSKIELVLHAEAKLFDGSGMDIPISDLYESFEVSGKGSVVAEDKLIVTELRVTKSPNIILMSPRSGDEAGLPVEIRGVARVFENNLNVRVKDSNGKVLAEAFTMANSPDMGKYGVFAIDLNYSEPTASTGYVEAFNYSAKDGSIENLVSSPIKFENVEAQILKVYFSNSKKDPRADYCARTYPVERRVPKSEAPGRTALEELIRGVLTDEGRAGYFSSIPQVPRVEINKLVIENGLATIDFNSALSAYGGGSCKVAAIRSQIENTIKQFSSVKKVDILIDGSKDDVLQP
ncbi:MAG: hypothetical protein UW46_C0001G0054 [Candidatus Yanofskybacteria bacterium GW2011_GWF1_44_227]|uniref:GerMN domain-containing protein n=1 Tax=Candidatus Yanofskybacteria bacterium GW2011_GWE2_40_11 TaxID=1619033 RepID=A0A0G0TSH3_9BACT|nr:MAG: hypothetical protein UT69_C0022G0008 [Candidatus Yanofskybacteria bacterium GW2011_GWE1_40_10]KKR40807.1 MAG: hypothetical protein UT75_C0004G0018 [Candidatus Yanofskybacteria bacterium GW2011_GWE2_40_11]KKT15922.1 MAG: hypothetical protein UV97_C0001G0095 [Candidatus Yanofskybacteria bacterium GW2011_GWF2_43_596]KKT53564.1 MAG: hypothetical protein UW46_C0001G0054 [Candidatus Yanofskybacteria bacterium GW2011_GWF1_44_227]OGN36089.1 MAG: hypothetical protein A2207_03460 [Candidatus Yano